MASCTQTFGWMLRSLACAGDWLYTIFGDVHLLSHRRVRSEDRDQEEMIDVYSNKTALGTLQEH